jgi:hypothetical protein
MTVRVVLGGPGLSVIVIGKSPKEKCGRVRSCPRLMMKCNPLILRSRVIVTYLRNMAKGRRLIILFGENYIKKNVSYGEKPTLWSCKFSSY